MKRSRGGEKGLFLNYTVVQDGAPGPNISDQSLALYLRNDPVFLEIDEDDRVYTSASGEAISIPVRPTLEHETQSSYYIGIPSAFV